MSSDDARRPEDAVGSGELPWEVAALALLPAAVLLADDRGVRWANAAAGRLFATTPAAIVGRALDPAQWSGYAAVDELGRPIDIARTATAQVLATGRPVHGRLRLVAPDGAVAWLTNDSVPIEVDGRPAVLTVIADQSAHHAAEEVLRSSGRQLHDVVDALGSSVFVKDREGRYTFVNARFLQDLGLTAGAVLGRTAAELVGDPGADPLSPIDDEVLRTGVPSTAVEDLVRDGRRRSFLVAKVPLRDKEGAIVALAGVSTDITAQIHLAEDSGRLAAVVHATAEAVITVDLDMRITSCNGGAERMMGVTADEMRGRSYLDVTTGPREAITAVLQQALSGTAVRDMQMTATSPDGEPSVRAGSAYPVRADDGEVTGAAIVLRDVTGEKRAEDEHAELQRRLEQKHRLESLGALAGGIAHDFNNVLAAVNLTAEAVARRLAPGSADRRDIESISAIAQRGASLTRQMSVFARGRPPRRAIVDLNDAVSAADALLQRTLGEHVTRVLSLSTEPCLVEGDLAELEQVVVNLATNARDAMPDGGTLTVTTRVADRPDALPGSGRAVAPAGAAGRDVVLTVSDSGTGMRQAVVDHAFEPFFTTKALGVGTGLGLAMVLGVAEQGGGGAAIDSRPGAGTTVRVTWPLRSRPSVESEIDLPDGPAAADPTAGSRVVVVEDEATLREAMVRVLRDRGYLVEAYGDGTAARAALAGWTEAPALLVSDVVLPGVTGPALVSAARERFPELRVLLVSGYTGGLLGNQATADADLLEKPFDSAALVGAVRAALRRAGPAVPR